MKKFLKLIKRGIDLFIVSATVLLLTSALISAIFLIVMAAIHSFSAAAVVYGIEAFIVILAFVFIFLDNRNRNI